MVLAQRLLYYALLWLLTRVSNSVAVGVRSTGGQWTREGLRLTESCFNYFFECLYGTFSVLLVMITVTIRYRTAYDRPAE